MLGYTETELIGKTFHDFTFPDDIARSEVMKENVVHRRFAIKYVKRLVRKDGAVIYVRMTNFARYGKDGQLQFSVGIAEDITRQNELEHLQSQLAAIVESSSDAIFSVNLEGTIQTWNRGAERMYGYTAEEAVHKTAKIVLADTLNNGPCLEAIAKAKAGFNTTNLEVVHHTKSGKHIPVALTVSPIRNEYSQVEGMSLIARDMTEFKHTLDALHKSEKRMRKTSENLARTNKELEQFVFVASHDLQEPLRTVGCFLQLLEDKYKSQLDTQAEEYISFAVQGARRMQRLIQDLLQFSRSTNYCQDMKPVKLSSMVESAISNLQSLIEMKDVLIHCDDLPTVLSQDRQLVQVFQNLISNAIKFHSDTRPEIHIRARKESHEWIISVEDNGIGFSGEHADRIFLIFQRLHTREEYPGTGVGLAICKKIVEAHGGRIWAESTKGKGSTFFFSVPAYLEIDQPVTAPMAPVNGSANRGVACT